MRSHTQTGIRNQRSQCRAARSVSAFTCASFAVEASGARLTVRRITAHSSNSNSSPCLIPTVHGCCPGWKRRLVSSSAAIDAGIHSPLPLGDRIRIRCPWLTVTHRRAALRLRLLLDGASRASRVNSYSIVLVDVQRLQQILSSLAYFSGTFNGSSPDWGNRGKPSLPGWSRACISEPPPFFHSDTYTRR